MAKIKSLAAALRAARNRPQGGRPAMQRMVREGCIASLGRALQDRLGARWLHSLDPAARGPSMLEPSVTTVMG